MAITLNPFLRLTFARHLGHGRRAEGFSFLAKALGAFVYWAYPHSSASAAGTAQLYWLGWGAYLFFPFLLATLFTGYGLIGNVLGWPYTRGPRFIGAFIGFAIWLFLDLSLVYSGATASTGFVLGLPMAFYVEMGIMCYAVAGVPKPGAPGTLT